jgi:hypothetical protein
MSSHPPIKAFVDLVRANAKENMKVAEVGVYDGSTTFNYIDIIKENKGHLYLIDWFQGNEGNASGIHKYRENGDPLYNQLIKEIEDRGFSEFVTILYGKSHDMSKNIEDNSLDICFLDADHRYAGCVSDIKDYYPKVKQGGFLCGHDCEDINISHLFRPEDMLVDYINGQKLKDRKIPKLGGCHPGVITAVYERFKDTVELIGDTVWVKKVDKSEDKIHTIPKFI